MHRLNTAFILGYHGCSVQVAEQLLSGAAKFKVSENNYDWLGPGTYFWQSNPVRAMQSPRKSANEKTLHGRLLWSGRH